MKIAIYDPASRKVLHTITTKKLRTSQLAVIAGRPYVIFDSDIDLKGATLNANDEPVFDAPIVKNFKRPAVAEIPTATNLNTYIDALNNVNDLKDLLKGLVGARTKYRYKIDMNALSDITPDDLPLFQAAIDE